MNPSTGQTIIQREHTFQHSLYHAGSGLMEEQEQCHQISKPSAVWEVRFIFGLSFYSKTHT